MKNLKRLLPLTMLVCSITVAAQQTTPPAPPEEPTAQKIKWYRDYHSGMQLAKMNKRPVVIKFSAAWCGWCVKMDNEVLNQPSVIAELKKFTCVKVDTDKDRSTALAYGVRSLPRMLVINTHDEIVGDWLGYREVDAFLALIKDIQQYTHVAMGTTKVPQIDPSETSPASAASTESGTPPEPKTLVDRLGHRDPAIRQSAIETLVARGRAGLNEAVDLLAHDYLGVRIAAWQTVRKMNSTALEFNPWASRSARSQAIEKLKAEMGDV